jgi:hypothetical protein
VKRKPSEALSAEAIASYLTRFESGESFESLLADFTRATGYSKNTLKDLLRGVYATSHASEAYARLGYAKRSIRFAPRNFQARLFTPQLLDIRRRSREGQTVPSIAAQYRLTRPTVDLIVTGRYASLAMQEALAAEAQAQQ